MVVQQIVNVIRAIVQSSYTAISLLIQTKGYTAIFILMLLEGASLPLPSEVIVPLAGFFAAKGYLNLYVAYLAALAGSVGGLAIDYYIGYYLGKKIIYSKLKVFHVRKKVLKRFDGWFEEHGTFAIFVSRLLPEIRTWMSFPAGFTRMPLKKFFAVSIAGAAIWDLMLILFGYYVVATQDATIVGLALGGFLIVIYLLYRFGVKRIKHQITTHPTASRA